MRTLQVGKNDIYNHSVYLKQLVLSPATSFTDCFTLNFRMSEESFLRSVGKTKPWDRVYYFDLLKIRLAKEINIHDAQLIITSEKNSFGAVLYQWFDGLFQYIKVITNRFYFIHISKTRRYEYVQGTCSEKSFYECVADNLKLLRNCQSDGEPCSPFSLPKDVPICLMNATECWQEITKAAFPKCMAVKSCTVQEYNRFNRLNLNLMRERNACKEIIQGWGGDEQTVEELLDKPDETFILSISFDDLDWSNGDRKKELLVDVFKEYYVWTEFSLVGSIGGQMGLFVGFSFLGCSGWLIGRIRCFDIEQ